MGGIGDTRSAHDNIQAIQHIDKRHIEDSVAYLCEGRLNSSWIDGIRYPPFAGSFAFEDLTTILNGIPSAELFVVSAPSRTQSWGSIQQLTDAKESVWVVVMGKLKQF